MTQIKPDTIVYSNLTEAYLNYDTKTGVITIPADNVADGDTASYSAIIPYTRGRTRADIYLQRTDTGVKIPANIGRAGTLFIYQFTSTETAPSVQISYSTSSITVTLSTFNGTGGPITLIAQTINAIAVLTDAPFST